MNNGRAPTAVFGMVQSKGDDLRMFREDGVNGAAKVADAFAVDDANLENAPFETSGQIIRNQVLHF